MTDHDALVFANEAFYAAFRDGDMSAMEQLWATDTPVFCIHPGWNPLFGRDQVLHSWRRIMRGGSRPNVICHDPKPHIMENVGTVICFEQIGADFLVATNMFVRQSKSNIWRLFHHHAGPAASPPDIPTSDAPVSMN